MTIIARRVTQRGVLVPRALIRAWGNIQEVEIEQRPDAVVIKPKTARAGDLRDQVVSKMKAAGLIEELPWPQPPRVSAEVRARLAEKLSHGKPLSEILLEDREEYA
ncbi:MAG: hypothetical protein CVU38_20880 [Chloroflexi bacterium HGW-Chloroflexi-1]|nr:MAG: hypothetical protein CVU38_20880 [Chloroflexi bacterium HGW-Chloroflexi-1]